MLKKEIVIKIEKRPYGPDSTEAEIQMLKDRVELLDDSTIYIDEVPIMSPFEIEVTTKQIAKYLRTSNARFLIINLIGTQNPDVVLRAEIKKHYSPFAEHLEHIAFYTGNNKLINLIAKFMVRVVGNKKYSFHKTREQAFNAIEADKKNLNKKNEDRS